MRRFSWKILLTFFYKKLVLMISLFFIKDATIIDTKIGGQSILLWGQLAPFASPLASALDGGQN